MKNDVWKLNGKIWVKNKINITVINPLRTGGRLDKLPQSINGSPLVRYLMFNGMFIRSSSNE